MWKLLKAYEPLKCYNVDYDYGKTIVYIFKKDNLEFVKTMKIAGAETFIIYHFTNGYV